MDRDVFRLIDRRRATGLAYVHQVVRDFGLSIDHHGLAGQALEVDAMADAAETDLRSIVRQALAPHPFARASFFDKRDRALFQHAGADAAEHVVLGFLLEDDRVDPGVVQQLPQKKAGGT